MKKIIIALVLFCAVFKGHAQSNPFPTTDSLIRYINKHIRNSAVDAFTNNRLNTAMQGIARFSDSALNFATRGVDTVFRSPGKDSVIYTINGIRRAIKDSTGTPVKRVNDTTFLIGTDTMKITSGSSNITDTTGLARKANNLADIANKSVAVNNLGAVFANTGQQSGTVFSDNFARSSFGANYTATGGTFTFPSSAYLQMSAGDGTFNNYVVRNKSISTHQHTDSLIFVPTVINSSSFGVSMGVQSWQAGTKRDLLAQFSVSNTTLVGNITIYGQPDYPTAILVQSSSLSFSAGDTLLAILVRNDNIVTATYTDLSTTASVSCTYTYPTTNVSGYLLHNTGNPILYNNGGTNKVLFWKVTNNQSKTNDAIIGNSLLSYDASVFSSSWPNLLYNARSDYSAVCGPGDRTAQALTQLPELLSYVPKKVFVDLGVNDLLGSVSAATFSTNYDSICHYIANLNIPAYLISISPTTTSVIAFNDTIQLKAIKYGFTYIDIYDYLRIPAGTTLAPVYDGGDGLHWSDAAHSLVASLLQPFRNRYSNNTPAGGVFSLTTSGNSGPSTYIGNILNIPTYAGLSSLTTGRIPVANGTTSVTDYPELKWDNPTKRLNINGTLQVGDQTLTHTGYNTIGVGGSAESGAVDYYDNGNFISEFYTTSSAFNLFTNTTLPLNVYTNGATTTPNIYAFSQKFGVNTGSPDSNLTVVGGFHATGGLLFPLLASGNPSPSQSGARVALNIDANGRAGTYIPSLENILANGADLSNSYTSAFGANSWIMNQNSTGRFKINGMRTASGTYTVLTKNADSSFTQISLAALASVIGSGGGPIINAGSTYRVGKVGTDSLKTLTPGVEIIMDTVTANQVKIFSDTSASNARIRRISDSTVQAFATSLDVVSVKEFITTNATTINVDTIPISPGEHVTVTTVLDGDRDDGNSSVGAIKYNTFFMDASSTIHEDGIQNTRVEHYLGTSGGLSSANFTITFSGTLILIKFTGEGSTNILGKTTTSVSRKGAPL